MSLLKAFSKSSNGHVNSPNSQPTQSPFNKLTNKTQPGYIEGIYNKLKTLKSEKTTTIAYSDVLEVFTSCTDEYSNVFIAIELLNSSLLALIIKAEKEEANSNGLLETIIHNELINNIHHDISKISQTLSKSNFFGKLLKPNSLSSESMRLHQEPLKRQSFVQVQPDIVTNKVHELNCSSIRNIGRRSTLKSKTPALSVIPSDEVVIDNNFETQITRYGNDKVKTHRCTVSQVNYQRDKIEVF